MSVNALTSANGADLLQRLMQPAQQPAQAQGATSSAAVLKTAVAEAQLSESSLVASQDSGSLLNVYG